MQQDTHGDRILNSEPAAQFEWLGTEDASLFRILIDPVTSGMAVHAWVTGCAYLPPSDWLRLEFSQVVSLRVALSRRQLGPKADIAYGLCVRPSQGLNEYHLATWSNTEIAVEASNCNAQLYEDPQMSRFDQDYTGRTLEDIVQERHSPSRQIKSVGTVVVGSEEGRYVTASLNCNEEVVRCEARIPVELDKLSNLAHSRDDFGISFLGGYQLISVEWELIPSLVDLKFSAVAPPEGEDRFVLVRCRLPLDTRWTGLSQGLSCSPRVVDADYLEGPWGSRLSLRLHSGESIVCNCFAVQIFRYRRQVAEGAGSQPESNLNWPQRRELVLVSTEFRRHPALGENDGSISLELLQHFDPLAVE